MTTQSESFASAQAATSGSDRRAWVRYPCNREGTCQPLMGAKETQWLGMVQEVSRGGLRLLLNRRFEAGTLLQVELQGRQGGSPGQLLVRVVRVTPEASQWWVLGCAFVGEISEDEVQLLL